MFISEFYEEESLKNMISEIYKSRDAKNESFKRMPGLFTMLDKLGVQRGDYHIHLTDPSFPKKGFPIDHAFLVSSFHFLNLFIIAIM